MIICTIKTLTHVIFCCDLAQVDEEIQKLEAEGVPFSYEFNTH